MSSGNEVVETVDTAELIPGQRASRARVIAAGVTDDDMISTSLSNRHNRK